MKLKTLLLLITAGLLFSNASAQSGSGVLRCRQSVFATLRPLPKLSYTCRPDAANDYDEAILKWPERTSAIRDFMQKLSTFNSANWWSVSVDELNVCAHLGRAGVLDKDERQKFLRGDYPLSLLGDNRVRLYLASDPCYQIGYNGSNAFLLYRRGATVVVTQVLDGHFSRADNSVALTVANIRGEELIEVATATGGLQPYINNYYFTIDRRTGKAVPKKIFQEYGGLTNKITSALVLDDGTLPALYKEVRVIEGTRLAARFYAYEETADDETGDFKDPSGRNLRRITYRWNGRYYVKGGR